MAARHMPDVPAWRVSILRQDGAKSGEGILLDDRQVLTSSETLTRAMLGGAPTPAAELKLRFGAGAPTDVRVQLTRALTSSPFWLISLPAPVEFAPADVAEPRAGSTVFVAAGQQGEPSWYPAQVGTQHNDGWVELPSGSRSTAVPENVGAVIDEDGRLVGVTTSVASRMTPFNAVIDTVPGTISADESREEEAEQDVVRSPTAPEPSADEDRSGLPEPKLTSDSPTLDDRLSRRRYVDAIVAFLRHRDTRPPVTIGVMGSWGAGKTSLMRMVQDELDSGAAQGKAVRLQFDKGSRERMRRRDSERVTNAEVVEESKRTESVGGLRAGPAGGNDGWRPTVWFNPWMYQNGDQVWSGLAYAIIGQVTDRLPRGDRERFWLRLNMARIDRERIRQRWHRVLVSQALPVLGWWLLVLALGTLAVAVGGALNVWPGMLALVRQYGGQSTAISGAITVLASAGRALRMRNADADATFTRLLKPPPLPAMPADTVADPGYGGRLGFLHLVQTDIRHVLDLVATPERPLVVFVDDLDRCSPGTVAQVIEAINLFLAGEFPNCVFVLAMEPAAVVAHVEVAYQDLAAVRQDGVSLGWRFLEKVVQLPLRLPEPGAGTGAYLDHLLGADPLPEPRPAPKPRVLEPGGPVPVMGPNAHFTAERVVGFVDRSPTLERQDEALRRERREAVDRLLAAIVAHRPTAATLREAAVAAQRDVLERGEPLAAETLEAAERVFAQMYSDRAATGTILSALAALGPATPREIKRYVNLYRFYTFLAERERLRGTTAPDDASVAKAAAFTVRWPQLVALSAHADALTALESAAADDDAWHAAYSDRPPALRAFLATGPTMGPAGCRLLTGGG